MEAHRICRCPGLAEVRAQHLRVGLSVQHPVARRVRLKPHVHHALDHQPRDPFHLVGSRRTILEICSTLVPLVARDSETLVSMAHPDFREVLSKRNLALMREVSFVVRSQD